MQKKHENKSDVIETLDAVIENLKDFTAYTHPIAYGIRLGIIAAKDLIVKEREQMKTQNKKRGKYKKISDEAEINICLNCDLKNCRYGICEKIQKKRRGENL